MTSGSSELHPNGQALLAAAAAYNTGDIAGLWNFLSDDIVWHMQGRHRFSGTHRGREQVLAFMQGLKDFTANTATLEPVDVLASDKNVVVFMRLRAQHKGEALDVLRADCFVMNEEGRATEMFTLVDNQAAEDAFFAF
jgi:ketosteroid isomerase-like protein